MFYNKYYYGLSASEFHVSFNVLFAVYMINCDIFFYWSENGLHAIFMSFVNVP